MDNVTAINGTEYPRKDCVKIKDDFYVIADPTKENTEDHVCFLVGTKYYRLSAGSIVYDHFLKKYVLKTDINVENGVIGLKEDGTPIFGSFSIDPSISSNDFIYLKYKKIKFQCINGDMFEDSIWQEQLSTGIFYRRIDLPISEFNKLAECDESYKRKLDYNAGNSIKKVKKVFEKNYIPEYDPIIVKYPKVAKDYTFGLEFETIKGNIPSRVANKIGLIPLRDGSISGLEFVTIPHSGKKGVQAVLDSVKELKKRTTYDKECSLHIHVGNLPRTESFFIALTKVLCSVQEDVYKTFPFYTRGGYGIKRKDYTAPLPAVSLMSDIDKMVTSHNVKKNFEPIFEFLSGGHAYSDYSNKLSNVNHHPSDPSGNSKWYIKSRYRWVNMVPLLFGNKQTVEFRIHTATDCPTKVFHFLILCLAIVDMAKKNEKEILEGTLHRKNYSSILHLCYQYLTQFGDKYSNLYDETYSYWERRASYHTTCLRKGDLIAKEVNFINYNKIINKEEEKNKAVDSILGDFLSGTTSHITQPHWRSSMRNRRIVPSYFEEEPRIGSGIIGRNRSSLESLDSDIRIS